MSSIEVKLPAPDPLSDVDPFRDNLPRSTEPPTRESIKSFWIGFAGLALLTHVTICIELLATRYVAYWLREDAQKTRFRSWHWDAIMSVDSVSAESLLPCIVIATIVPVLYWRGGLAQRFALSGVFVLVAMNSSISLSIWDNFSFAQLRGLLAIAGCWAMFPVLFLMTPIRTRRLRLIVASCLLVLTFCVSILNMTHLRRSLELLYWEAVFGSAFVYALLRRNWGRVAMFESAAMSEQLERTSSRTLLELMAVSGLACASVMYWSESTYAGLLLYFAQASALGVACVLLSMTCYVRMRAWRPRHIALLAFLWLVMWAVLSANSILVFMYGRFAYASWAAFLKTPIATSVIASSCISSLYLVIHILIVGLWLRLCGWRIERTALERKARTS